MPDYVSTEHDGAVAVVTIDNPPMNALSAPLLQELDGHVVPLAEFANVGLHCGRQAEIVEQCRVQQAREIADGVQRAFGDRPGLIEHHRGSSLRLDAALRHGELHLDCRERLPDLVVQLARDGPPLFFLDGDQLRGQALEIAAVRRVACLLFRGHARDSGAISPRTLRAMDHLR